MIFSHLVGGLGNQMFQYAAGRAISLEHGVPLRLDISGFANYRLHHGFELQRAFNCMAGLATESDVRGILGWQYTSRIRGLLSRPSMAAFRRKELIVEPYFNYWPAIKYVPRDCYLVGYWQSEKYFCEVAPVIRADFTFKSPLVNRNAELAEQIDQVNAVSLHVRRGDYAKNPQTHATHGLCSLDYYRTAIRLVSDRVEQPYFFIFSDDIGWVKDNLNMNFSCQYVDHNHGTDSCNDMRLMSLCRHNIIANSSFSWWGAWLNPNAEKIVIAPTRWFTNNTDVSDLLPRGWVSL